MSSTILLANRVVSTVPPRQKVAKQLRNLAVKSEGDHPETHVHEHLRDAAAALDSGNTHAALRHLGGAAHTLTPVSLMRHGIQDDDGHALAKQNMGAIDRAILQIKQVQDTEAQNDAIQQRKAMETLADTERRAQAAAVRTGVLPGPDPLGAGPQAGQPGSVQSVKASAITPGEAAPPPSGAPAGGTAPPPKPAAKAPAAVPPKPGSTPPLPPGRPAAAPAAAQKPMVTKPTAPSRPAAKAAAVRSMSWTGVLGAIELSAQTGRLAATPAPLGRPGGPGLYHVKGMGFPPYFQNVRNALIRGGKDESTATQMTWGIIRRWARGGGKVHPEVRAAAVAALTSLKVKSGIAHGQAASHSHATWTDVDRAIELSTTTGAGGKAGGGGAPSQAKSQNAEAEPRVPKGSAGAGEFGKGGGAKPSGKTAPNKGDSKATLLQKERNDRARIRALEGTLAKLLAQQKAMAKSTAAATKAGSTGKSASSTPAKAAQATTSNNPAAAAASSKAPAAAGSSSSASTKSTSSAQLAAQITAVRGQIKILSDAAAAAAKAAKTAK